MTQFVKDVSVVVRVFLLASLSYVVPKRRNSWLFLPGHYRDKVAGNLKSFFRYVKRNSKEVRPTWVARDAEVAAVLGTQALVSSRRDLTYFWALLRAEHIIMDQGCPYIVGRFSVVQLWHGTGFKNILALNWRFDAGKWKRLCIRHFSTYSLVVASSESDKQRKIKAFMTDKVCITGSPRNDLFYSPDFDKSAYKRTLGIDDPSATVILYAPTFRQGHACSPFSPAFWQALSDWAVSEGALFLVKAHPSDKQLVVPKGLPSVVNVTDRVEDVQELLAATDILVSDYSGIVTDFVLTSRPVVFYVYDLEQYVRVSRTFYYDFQSTVPGPFARDESTLLALLMDRSWFGDVAYQAKYRAFVDRFHAHKDGDSCRRVFQEIERAFACPRTS